MDKFVKYFIGLSIVYLGIASVLGVLMFLTDSHVVTLKFAHSHLMLLGWVTMMIYGVGYHILPKFAGRRLKHQNVAEAQLWVANAGLIGMVVFYALHTSGASGDFRIPLAISGTLEAASIFMFVFCMMTTLFGKEPEPQKK